MAAHRRSLFLALAVVTVVVAGACSNGSSPAADTTTTTTAAATTSSAPTTTAARSNHCRSENLRGSLGETEAGAGQRYTALVLTNTGTTACELRGFPGVSMLDASGALIGQPAGREGTEGPTVAIAPGAAASATLHTNAPGTGGTCTAASSRLRLFPPDNTAAIEFAASYTACGQFEVTTLVAGTGGR